MSPVVYETTADGQLWRISTHSKNGCVSRRPAVEYACSECGKVLRTAQGRETPGAKCRRCHLNRARALNTWRPVLEPGTKRVSHEGYVLVKLAEDDPLHGEAHLCRPTQPAWAPEHRLVMRRAIGRPFRKGETVHHINGQKDDNRLENLQIWQGAHSSGGAYRCADCGSDHIVNVGIGGGGLV